MEPPMKPHRLAWSALPALALVAPLASAADSLALDPVSIWLGGYYANTEINVRGETNGGDISTGKIKLDSGDETVGRARLDVLLFGSQGLQFDYYTLDHSTTQTLSQPFSFQGVPFQIDTVLRGKFEFSAGTAAYHWWFGDATDAFGVGLGGAYYRAKLGISGTVALGDQTANGSASWDDDAIAPLITLGFHHAFNDSLRVYLDASGIYKNGGNLSGHLYDGRAGVEWFPFHNVGIAAEYGETRLKLDHEGGSYDANLDIKLHGPSLFARFRF
jgi:hypothetical protein